MIRLQVKKLVINTIYHLEIKVGTLKKVQF